jgi:hypothetical protein
MAWHRNRKTPTILYSGKDEGKHEYGVAFKVNNTIENNMLDFKAISERTCILRLKTKFL